MKMQNEAKEWMEANLISKDQFEKIESVQSGKIFSIFWELQFLLYAGVLMLTTGIGILIYKYIGSIGHILAILLIAAMSVYGYYYLHKKGPPYSNKEVEAINPYFDYVTLLSALLTGLLFTYIEVQFEAFGSLWTYIPLFLAVIYAYTAYRFDHKGVLALAMISFASFFGMNIQPDIFNLDSVFNSMLYSTTGIFLGVFFAGLSFFSTMQLNKAHFKAVYMNFAAWLILGSSYGAAIEEGSLSIFGIICLIACGLSLWYSWREKSSWFAVYGAVVGYALLTYMLIDNMGFDVLGFAWFYFLLSPILPILLIVKFNRHFKK